MRGLVEGAPKRSVSIDAVANALKSRGFQRSPGSPRLVTRLRRIRELLVSPSGTITLAEDGAPPANEPQVESEPRVESAARIVGKPIDEVAEAAETQEVEEVDDDRQPDFLRWRESEPEPPEIDGNRASPAPGPGSRPGSSGPPARSRRRRRRRWRGGPRQSAPGSQPA